MEAGEALVVIGSVNGDMFHGVLFEGGHEFVEVFFAAFFTQLGGGEVGVHTGAVPVGGAEWLTVVVDVDSILFAESLKDEASDPDLIGSFAGAFAKDLEFPLSLGDLGVDALVINSGVEAEVKVFVYDCAGDIADVFVANAAIVRALGCGVSAFGKTKNLAVFFKEVFLLESKPSVFVIEDAGAGVGRMGITVGKHDLAHDENAVFTGAVRVKGDWLENAVGVTTVSLLCGGAIEAPLRELLEGGEVIKFLDATFSTEVCDGCVSVEPDVIESVFSH